MDFLKFTYTFYLLSFSLLLQAVTGNDSAFVNSVCSAATFTPGEAFGSNLRQSFTSDAPTTRFAQNSVGQVHGLALCSAAIRNLDYQACREIEASEIPEQCAQNKAAVIWHCRCMLEYSDKKVFGSVDKNNYQPECNPELIRYPSIFKRKRRILFRRLAEQAHKNPYLYATGDIRVGQSDKIYGLAQCSRNISKRRCKQCLKLASRMLRAYCHDKIGGKFDYGSCILRYETYPLVIV